MYGDNDVEFENKLRFVNINNGLKWCDKMDLRSKKWLLKMNMNNQQSLGIRALTDMQLGDNLNPKFYEYCLSKICKVSKNKEKMEEVDINDIRMEQELDSIKTILDTIDNNQWGWIRRNTDVLKYVRQEVQNITGDSMVTNAWLKMYEILKKYPSLLNIKKVNGKPKLKAFYL